MDSVDGDHTPRSASVSTGTSAEEDDEIEGIVDVRKTKGDGELPQWFYKVRWVGGSEGTDEWFSREEVHDNAPEIAIAFERELRAAATPGSPQRPAPQSGAMRGESAVAPAAVDRRSTSPPRGVDRGTAVPGGAVGDAAVVPHRDDGNTTESPDANDFDTRLQRALQQQQEKHDRELRALYSSVQERTARLVTRLGGRDAADLTLTRQSAEIAAERAKMHKEREQWFVERERLYAALSQCASQLVQLKASEAAARAEVAALAPLPAVVAQLQAELAAATSALERTRSEKTQPLVAAALQASASRRHIGSMPSSQVAVRKAHAPQSLRRKRRLPATTVVYRVADAKDVHTRAAAIAKAEKASDVVGMTAAHAEAAGLILCADCLLADE